MDKRRCKLISGIESMKNLWQGSLFRASGQVAAQSRLCAFMFWFGKANKQRRKML
jgi:hypothetical protein